MARSRPSVLVARPTRVVTVIFVIVALCAALVIGGRAFFASDAGRSMIVRALPFYAPQSGLRVTAGRIEGNIFGRLRLHDLALADPAGVFARAPVLDLDWQPLNLLRNQLTVTSATAEEMAVLRRPRLRPSADTRILPDIDIAVGHLHITRLDLAAPVTGIAEVVGVDGSGEAVAGRARITLAATSASGGDVIRLHLDARPDADRFDIGATVVAPAKGTLARLLGLPATVEAAVGGRGTWREWHGTATATIGGRPLADLALTELAGRGIVAGTVLPAPLLDGMAARAAAGGVRLRADGRLTGRILTGRLEAASPEVRIAVSGTADFGHEILSGVRIGATALLPTALLPQLTGRDIVLDAHAAGTFAIPVVDYVVTSPAFAWGSTAFAGFRASGHVIGQTPLLIPVAASVTRVDGVGDAAPLLAGLRIAGSFTIGHKAATAPRLTVVSAGVTGTAAVRLAFDGDYTLGFDGSLPRYPIAGVGVANVSADIRAVPAPGGTRVTGTVRAVATRLDSDLFRSVFAGLPVVTSSVDIAPDLATRFIDLRVVSPGLRQTGAGTRDPAGLVRIATRGTSRDYGPATLLISGPIDAPLVDIALAAPGFGVTDLAAHIAPGTAGWTVAAHGTTAIGAATLAARLVPGGSGADLTANLAGVTAEGPLTFVAGQARGRLAIGGSGLAGTVALAPTTVGQRVDLDLNAVAAQVGATRIGRGTVSGHGVFGSGSPVGQTHITLADVRSAGVTLVTATATASFDHGHGTATATAAGTAGVPFRLALDARGGGDHVDLGANATIDGRPVAFDRRASIDRSGGVWRLAPVTIVTPDGHLDLAGSFGSGVTASVRADGLGLSLLTLIDPSFEFAGHASGTLNLAVPAVGAPTGTLALRISRLVRAGLAASAAPVDVAVNAALMADSASARAVIVAAGATLGRAQAALRLAPGGTLRDRIIAAPLVAQVRYAGPAQALWALGGGAALDVRGPVALAVDAGGHLGDPRLSGTVGAHDARIENVTSGTVVDNVTLDGRFAGSRLDVTAFSGTIGKGGKIAGRGSVDLSTERGFPLDATATLDNAEAIVRDDLRATATGTIRLHSDGNVGKVSGALDIVRARYRLGRPAANADVPVLIVAERNADLIGRAPPRPVKPTLWTLEIGLNARDNIVVAGLGLNSVWRGGLKITGRATAPEITGRVQLVRGDYDFSGKRFALTRGNVRFAGGTPPDPVVDIVAENTSSGFTANLTLSGTALHPDIRFASIPALPEDEVLSRVLFGSSITTLSAPEAVQLAGALASLRTNGRGVGAALDPFGAVRKGLKIDRLRALPADTLTGRKTSIAAGKYIGRRLYVELATDAQGYSATAVEFALSRTFSVLSTVATLGGTSANLRLKRDY